MAAKSSNLPMIAFAAAAVAVVGAVLYLSGVFSPSPAPTDDGAVRRVSMSDVLAEGPLPEMALGAEDAPVTIVEYASLTCGHCGNFHKATFPELREKYIDTGKVRLIFRDFPLDRVATAGAMLARCSSDENFFPIVSAFFDRQNTLFASEDALQWLTNFSRQVGYSQESMESCLTNQDLQAGIESVKRKAETEFGVSSTPTFIINGAVYPGDMSLAQLESRILPLLDN